MNYDLVSCKIRLMFGELSSNINNKHLFFFFFFLTKEYMQSILLVFGRPWQTLSSV